MNVQTSYGVEYRNHQYDKFFPTKNTSRLDTICDHEAIMCNEESLFFFYFLILFVMYSIFAIISHFYDDRQFVYQWLKTKIVPNDTEECVICMDCMSTENLIVQLPCKHRYHMKCIQEWLKYSKSCPVCRRMFFLYGPSMQKRFPFDIFDSRGILL